MNLEKCYGIYNPKLDFKMLCQLNKQRNIKESLYKQKCIFEGKTNDIQSNTEIHLKKSLDAYNVLKNCHFITEKELLSAYHSFERKPINSKDIQSLEMLINTSVDTNLESAIRVLKLVIKNNIFNNYSDELAILLFNYMLIRNNFHPIIFYNSFMINLSEMIKNGALSESIYRIMLPMIEVSVEYNKIQGKTNIDEVSNIIISVKKELHEKFSIQNVYIYGSLARGDQTIYSDIDLILITDKYSEFTNDEARKFMKKLFKQRLDIVFIDENKTVENMTTDFYTQRIKIF